MGGVEPTEGARRAYGVWRWFIGVMTFVLASLAPAHEPSASAVGGGWFEPFPLEYTLLDGDLSPDGNWFCAWTGYGDVGTVPVDGDLVMNLVPAQSTRRRETHSSLVVTTTGFTDHLLELDVRTVEQLRVRRRGRRMVPNPRPWEVAWLLWRVADLGNFYYFAVKTNGVEFGKVEDGVQYFLATTSWPTLTVSAWNHWTIWSQGNRFIFWVDGVVVMDYTDWNASRALQSGAIGLYCEDAQAQFDNVRVTLL